jgi:hypothetical protein
MLAKNRNLLVATAVCGGFLAVAFVIFFALQQSSSVPVKIEVRRASIPASGNETVRFVFKNESTRLYYIGWFVTEELIGDRWREAGVQNADALMAIGLPPETETHYDIPRPKEAGRWRVRFTGQLDYNQVSKFKRTMQRWLETKRVQKVIRPRNYENPVLEAVSEEIHGEDF